MLYEQSERAFSKEGFLDPGACYRGAPFWAWNTYLTKEMIEEQILQFKKMGMGGFHVHVRVGLKNQYLGEEFLELVQYCNEKAKENGMLCWLYDEDRYSSGIAGGEVTRNVFFRARWLRLTVCKREEMLDSYEEFLEKQRRNEKVRGCLLKVYDIVLEEGYLKKASVIGAEEAAEGAKWYLYEELAGESPWCNNQTYVDTMKAEAVRNFIHLTHEKYAGVLQEDFGKSIPAIFTDEPHINGLKLPKRAEALEDILLPYTETLPERYGKAENMDFWEGIPYMIWNTKEEKACFQRYHYYDVICQMFTEAYCRQIGSWCEKHHLLSTGHILGEENLHSQTCTVGEAMRCYREFQIPGVDNLCDLREFGAVKQAASVAHQCGKEGVLSELYGVTQWDFDFEGYKLAGDWQAALGVTVRVPHLAWASMNGEAKRDYPAAIGWQSPWYEDYSYIEDHFARVNYCLTRGKPVIRVGVLHPVESCWLLQGPGDQSKGKQEQLEDDFRNVTEWLLTGGIDFDYISESFLAQEDTEGGEEESGRFRCGEMEYEVVLLPDCINLRKVTVDKLLRFTDAGGTVIFLGDVPKYVDCKPGENLEQLIGQCEQIRISRQALLERMDAWRDVDFWDQRGMRTGNLLYQMREEEGCRWLFVAQAYKGLAGRQNTIWDRRALHGSQNLEIRIKGSWQVKKYDTLTGEEKELEAVYRKGKQEEQNPGLDHLDQDTVICCEMYGDDSLLLQLKPLPERNLLPEIGLLPENEKIAAYGPGEERQQTCDAHRTTVRQSVSLPEPVGYRMSEPNVLLLDHFEYALDDEEYQEACEILKLDNRLREKLHLPLKCESLAQPYVRMKEEVREHQLHLRTHIYSTVELSDCSLALEEAQYCTGTLNGEAISMEKQGYYVDPAITMVRLPRIKKGINELELDMAYGDCTNLEWMYVLGKFGVGLQGAHSYLYSLPEKLYWGDYTRQGFPFYTGNMTYLVRLPGEEKGGRQEKNALKNLQVPYYSGAAVKVAVNHGEEQMLAFLPYQCELKNLTGQEDELQITCLGNRYNGFGQLHLIGDDLVWLGPDSWRSEGNSWTDTYQIRPMGILSAPQLHIVTDADTADLV